MVHPDLSGNCTKCYRIHKHYLSMLHKLSIRNYALIKELSIDFSEQLNVITGETGAGKSIMLGALRLIFGERVPQEAVSRQEDKCCVEASFDISKYQLQKYFEGKDIPYRDELILKREISPTGYNSISVNEVSANIQVLKDLSNQLVNMHAQHDTLLLKKAQYQLDVLDALAGNTDLLNIYRNELEVYHLGLKELAKMKSDLVKWRKEYEYMAYQLQELEEAELNDPEEQDEIEQELALLNNVENIQRALEESTFLLDEADSSVLQQLKSLIRSLEGVGQYHESLSELAQRLQSCHIELADIQGELEVQKDSVTLDPERALQLNERINVLNRLQNKHKKKSLQELIDFKNDLDQKINGSANSEEAIQLFEETLAKAKDKLFKQASKISRNRKKQIPLFVQAINEMLHDLGMVNAFIKIERTENPNKAFNSNGLESIEILFTANKGSEPMGVSKVASGGEMSRLMLCIQTLMAERLSLPTLIFDEIDTGISGATALKVGKVLKRLGNAHQVICITHLPQIAGMGDRHFSVFKKEINNYTNTFIKVLEPQERAEAIAQMVSGENPTKSAIANAKELLKQAAKLKQRRFLF